MSSYARTMGMTQVPFKRGRGRPPVYGPKPAPKSRGRPRKRTNTPVGTRLRLRMRGPGSSTQSRLRRNNRVQGPLVFPGQGSKSFFTHSKRPDYIAQHIFRQLVGRNSNITQEASFVTSTTGRQATLDIGSLFNTVDIKAIKNEILPVVATDPTNDLTINGSSAKSAKIYFKNALAIYHFKNQTNITAKMTILDILCTKDPSDSSTADPLIAWQTGVYHDINESAKSIDKQVGQLPMLSDEFRKYYKVLKRTQLYLSAGDIHEHIVKYNVKKIMNSVTCDNLQYENISNWTVTTMIIFHGTLANDTVDNTKVTYAPIKIDYAVNKVYKYGYMLNNYNSIKQISSHISTVPNALEHMGDADEVTRPVNQI